MWRHRITSASMLSDIYGPQYAWLEDDQFHSEPVVKKLTRNQRKQQSAAKRHRIVAVQPVVPRPAAGTCGICREPASVLEHPGSDCQHEFCTTCLQPYLTSQIGAGRISRCEVGLPVWEGQVLLVELQCSSGIRCPAEGCRSLIEHDQVARYVRDVVRERYEHLLQEGARGYVSCKRAGCGGVNPAGGECVMPQCRVAQLQLENQLAQQRWLKLSSAFRVHLGDLMKAAAVFRCCPACGVCIEKNGGCNKMECAACQTHFDWSKAPSIKKADSELFEMLSQVMQANRDAIYRFQMREFQAADGADYRRDRLQRLADMAAREKEVEALNRMWRAIEQIAAERETARQNTMSADESDSEPEPAAATAAIQDATVDARVAANSGSASSSIADSAEWHLASYSVGSDASDATESDEAAGDFEQLRRSSDASSDTSSDLDLSDTLEALQHGLERAFVEAPVQAPVEEVDVAGGSVEAPEDLTADVTIDMAAAAGPVPTPTDASDALVAEFELVVLDEPIDVTLDTDDWVAL